MSSQWICTKCGTTAYSKCPSQRNIFPGMETAIWGSILATNVIHGHGDRAEIVLSITDYVHSDLEDTARIVKVLSDMFEHKDTIANVICKHDWVINSETETECTLGCTHRNLKSEPRAAKPKELFSIPAMMKETHSAIYTILEQARIIVNTSKSEFDHYAEEQMQNLKYEIARLLTAYGAGELVMPKYRVELYFGYKDPRNKTASFDSDATADVFIRGLYLQGFAGSINTDVYSLQSNRYERIDWNLETTCPLCGKSVDITGPVVNGNTHIDCHTTMLKRSVVKTQWLDLPMPNKLDKEHFSHPHQFDDWSVTRLLNRILGDHRHQCNNYVEIEESKPSDRWVGVKGEACRRVVSVRVACNWYDAKNMKQIFLEN